MMTDPTFSFTIFNTPKYLLSRWVDKLYVDKFWSRDSLCNNYRYNQLDKEFYTFTRDISIEKHLLYIVCVNLFHSPVHFLVFVSSVLYRVRTVQHWGSFNFPLVPTFNRFHRSLECKLQYTKFLSFVSKTGVGRVNGFLSSDIVRLFESSLVCHGWYVERNLL